MTVASYSLLNTTILLLVSDPIVRSVLEETLTCEGYMVLSANDLGQAVDELKRSTPDLLLTRTYVASMPGHDAAMYLRNKCTPMRVLIVGACSMIGAISFEKRCKDLKSSQNHIAHVSCSIR
jgi:CheY-like chemotaxis protein